MKMKLLMSLSALLFSSFCFSQEQEEYFFLKFPPKVNTDIPQPVLNKAKTNFLIFLQAGNQFVIRPEPNADFSTLLPVKGMLLSGEMDFVKHVDLNLFDEDEIKETSGGSHVGNGGDVAFCVGKNMTYSGMFTLDYLVPDTAYLQTAKIVEMNSWQPAYYRLLKKLSFNLELKQKYELFMKGFFQGKTANIEWRKKTSRLSHLPNDKMLSLKFPSNCNHIAQIVKRYENKHRVVYYADIELLNAMRTYYPVQFSMIMFHEFMWFVTKDLNSVRMMNYFVHSDWVDSFVAKMGEAGLAAWFEKEFPNYTERLNNVY